MNRFGGASRLELALELGFRSGLVACLGLHLRLGVSSEQALSEGKGLLYS